MPNKCAIFNCKTNYGGGAKDSTISFPRDDNLRQKRFQFVNRKDWKWSKHSVICIYHFEEKYIKRYKKKILLDRKANPIPSIYFINGNNVPHLPPSVLPNIKPLRKAPVIRIQHKDELQDFRKIDSIKCLQDLTASKCPNGFSFQHLGDSVVYYKMPFNNGLPVVKESIQISYKYHYRTRGFIFHYQT